jgi:vanillate O-demethylase ferredoxin subunit
MRHEASQVLSLELVPLPPETELPAFGAGAHIDLQLPGGLLRSYSLLNDPAERHRYVIAVNRDANSRGGSRHVHEVLRPGETLTISAPRNNFMLHEPSNLNVFIAGGIGITPILSMIARTRRLGGQWKLHYAARTREHAAFLDLLQSWAAQDGAELALNFDQEPGGRMLDIAQTVASQPAHAHLYCCGPLPMLGAFERAAASWPTEQVHVEYFAAREAAVMTGGFTVKLARSGRVVRIQAGQSILDGLQAIGMEPLWSCREGVCGTCEVRVLEGKPDHRDVVLSSAEKAGNQRMMICCSGALSEQLVLDL